MDQHEMRLSQTYPSGAQEWVCLTCGRWILMHHLPEQGKLKTIVLQPGDEEANHAGSTGGVNLGEIAIAEAPEQVNGTLQ